jgi:hypothetical protein
MPPSLAHPFRQTRRPIGGKEPAQVGYITPSQGALDHRERAAFWIEILASSDSTAPVRADGMTWILLNRLALCKPAFLHITHCANSMESGSR